MTRFSSLVLVSLALVLALFSFPISARSTSLTLHYDLVKVSNDSKDLGDVYEKGEDYSDNIELVKGAPSPNGNGVSVSITKQLGNGGIIICMYIYLNKTKYF